VILGVVSLILGGCLAGYAMGPVEPRISETSLGESRSFKYVSLILAN